MVSGIFHVNENKDIVTAVSKIHDFIFGIVYVLAFILALIFFICFIMGDKEQFQNTMLRYESPLCRLETQFLFRYTIQEFTKQDMKSEEK